MDWNAVRLIPVNALLDHGLIESEHTPYVVLVIYKRGNNMNDGLMISGSIISHLFISRK
jgi:hypothetical protein